MKKCLALIKTEGSLPCSEQPASTRGVQKWSLQRLNDMKSDTVP